jgi:zinc D-Ala-D-Ala carboxypeptidase
MARGAGTSIAAAVAIAVVACGPTSSATHPAASPSPPPTPLIEITPTPPVYSPTPTRDTPPPAEPTATPAADALDQADGLLPARATAFDDEYPGVANMDPLLLEALRKAATDAAQDGVVLRVTSGWRSAELQNYLFREAVAEYGSEEEAARWVATPDKSLHVSGDAVDIAPVKARKWLSKHGADYGLCQIYRNEPWHFELRPEAIDGRCPRMYANPTQDPRMQ